MHIQQEVQGGRCDMTETFRAQKQEDRFPTQRSQAQAQHGQPAEQKLKELVHAD